MTNRRQRRRLLVATAIVMLVLAADVLSGGKIRSLVREGGTALWRAGSGALAHVGESGFFASRASLSRENQLLKDEIAHLQEQSTGYSTLAAENAQLRAIVHLAQSTPGLTAPVTSSFKASPYGTFVIGAGSGDGVVKDSIVATGDGFVIGRVTDVSVHQSLVKELFAPGASVEASVDGIPVVLKGQGGANAQGDLPRGAKVAVGDPVFASAFGQRAIGIVGAVEARAASASTKIYVRSPVNLEALSFVYVEIVH
jgi:cell shape-determining protein MreC